MTTVYKDSKIDVSATGRNCDFIATIWNKSDQEIRLLPKLMVDGQILSNENDAPICVPGNDWVGILADDYGYLALDAFANKRFDYA